MGPGRNRSSTTRLSKDQLAWRSENGEIRSESFCCTRVTKSNEVFYRPLRGTRYEDEGTRYEVEGPPDDVDPHSCFPGLFGRALGP